MAKAKVRDDVDESLIEATDIVSLLSEPGFAEIYDREITQIDCRDGFELPSVDLSSLCRPFCVHRVRAEG